MTNKEFSFVILTYNEEIHLPRLLKSIQPLAAATYILDSGSTDRTTEIAAEFGAIIQTNAFINHPRQWHFALNNFPVTTPFTIGLDADQIVTPELLQLLQSFKAENHSSVNGIYFNRKNFFRGRWIRFGGFYPKYLLKMFRTGVGYSDLNENMDHRFIAPGESIIWKKGHILEENLKENKIGFWLDKHNRYSDLVAIEEFERASSARKQPLQPRFWGNPDERIAWLKKLWWKLPLGFRPFLYFGYRFFIRLGFLDGSAGMLFHFLQGFWFRLIVDVKIIELQKNKQTAFGNKPDDAF